MPGRIKPAHNPRNGHIHEHAHQHMKPRPHLAHIRRQEAPPPAGTTPAAPQSGGLFDNNIANPKSFVLNKQTIIWLVVISVIVVATLIIVSCLLCKCKRRRKGVDGKLEDFPRHANGTRWHPSLEIKDGRNDFQAWNRHAPPRASLAEQGGVTGEPIRMDTFESADSVTPLRPAAMRGGNGNGSAVMEPIVVDYATGGTSAAKKNSRYYSNLSSGRGSIWKRVSQMGRAY